MSKSTDSRKIEKYQFQCDLVYATLALTKPYRNPTFAHEFLKKWFSSGFLQKPPDKHLRHGFNLFLQLISDETNGNFEVLPHEIFSICETFQKKAEMNNLFLANETVILSNVLGKSGISSIALKGISYYFLFDSAYFQSRLSSDIDLLIPKKTLRKAIELFTNLGYSVLKYDAPMYRTNEEREANYYEYTLAKQQGELVSEIGLHWNLPTGTVVQKNGFPFFEILPEEKLEALWKNKREIQWQNGRLNVLSNEDLLTHFLMNVNRDLTGQINICRWLLAAKDFFELETALSTTNLFKQLKEESSSSIQKKVSGLAYLSDYLFGGKVNESISIPNLFYRSLTRWTPKKKHAREVWLALFLSKYAPAVFKMACLCHGLWQNKTDEKILEA